MEMGLRLSSDVWGDTLILEEDRKALIDRVRNKTGLLLFFSLAHFREKREITVLSVLITGFITSVGFCTSTQWLTLE